MEKENRHFLAWALLLSMLLFMAAGAWLKYDVLRPLGLYQDKNIVELPLLLAADHGMRAAVRDAMESPQEPEDIIQTNPAPTTGRLEPSETVTEAPEETTAEVTIISTEPPTEPSAAPETEPETVPSTTAPPPTQPPETKPPETAPTQPPTTAPADTQPPPTEPQKPAVTNPTLEFTGPAVDWSWFDDVLFIGDSRTVGLRDYARSGDADYFCTVGMSSFNVLKDSTTASDEDFPSQTLVSLLSAKTYRKIIITLGINECGYSTSSLIKQYKKVIQTVRDVQPDAIIIIQSIMTVGRKKAASADYFQPSHLFAINDKLEAIANGTDIFYIDVNEAFADSAGYLPDTFSRDGCHLYATYTKYWADWMRYAVAALGL